MKNPKIKQILKEFDSHRTTPEMVAKTPGHYFAVFEVKLIEIDEKLLELCLRFFRNDINPREIDLTRKEIELELLKLKRLALYYARALSIYLEKKGQRISKNQRPNS